MNDRATALRADAIAVIAKRALGIDVDSTHALRLAEGGSIERAISGLDQRLRVQRATRGLPSRPEVQQRLAVAEVASELSPVIDADTKRRLSREFVVAEVELQRRAERAAAQIQSVQDMIASLERAEPARRAFFRAVDRLLSSQVSRLRAAVQGEVYEQALAELTNLYTSTIGIADMPPRPVEQEVPIAPSTCGAIADIERRGSFAPGTPSAVPPSPASTSPY